MNLVKVEVTVDVTKEDQVEALNSFLTVIGGNEEKPKKAPRKPRAQKPKVEKVEETTEETKEIVVNDAKEVDNGKDNTSIKIEDIRKLLSEKVKTNRQAIKDKLSELGAPNVTSLDKANYEEFNTFLNSLD